MDCRSTAYSKIATAKSHKLHSLSPRPQLIAVSYLEHHANGSDAAGRSLRGWHPHGGESSSAETQAETLLAPQQTVPASGSAHGSVVDLAAGVQPCCRGMESQISVRSETAGAVALVGVAVEIGCGQDSARRWYSMQRKIEFGVWICCVGRRRG